MASRMGGATPSQGPPRPWASRLPAPSFSSWWGAVGPQAGISRPALGAGSARPPHLLPLHPCPGGCSCPGCQWPGVAQTSDASLSAMQLWGGRSRSVEVKGERDEDSDAAGL